MREGRETGGGTKELRVPTAVVERACRRYVTTDAMGMAKVRGRREEEDVDGAGIGPSTDTVKDTTVYPGSGLSVEITPLLLLVSSISMN